MTLSHVGTVRLPLATVVIPTYDDADHLIEALDLVRAQTWPHVEIIVVDDASSKPVEPRVRGWSGCDDRVNIMRRAVNGGVVAAQQTGLERARGEFIYLASTNDPIEPRFLEASINALLHHPNAGMCFSDAGMLEGWNGARQSFPLHIARCETEFDPDQLAALLRRRPFHISSNTVVFRARALREIGGCRANLGPYADWFACMVAALRDGAAYIPEVLAYSRSHPGAYSEPGRWDEATKATFAAAAVDAIASEMPDLLPRFRRSAAVSDFGPGVLIRLYRDARFRPVVGIVALWIALLRAGLRGGLPRAGRALLRRSGI
jgi:hypothetical protein